MMVALACTLISAAPALTQASGYDAASDLAHGRRLAIVVGENHGDTADPTLLYAETDALRVLEVLTRLGGVDAKNAVSLIGTNAVHLEEELNAVMARLVREQWGIHDQLFLYVSSHAGDGDLHLSGTRFPIHKLRDLLWTAQVGVAVLILDTCQAGSALRDKGLKPLRGNAVTVEEPELTGRVVIASSGATESAFESDRLRGSFFTYHLVEGMRGAADTSHDGVVTLQEAYSYAYARTVDSTFGSRSGTQKPGYDVKLKGQGDLVMTEIGRGHGRLRIDIEQPGSYLIVSLNGGATVSSFQKSAQPLVFAIQPGEYKLQLIEAAGVREASFRVPEDGEAIVSGGDLKRGQQAAVRRKGQELKSWYVGINGGIGTGVVSGLGTMPMGGVSVGRMLPVTILQSIPLLQVDVSYRQTGAARPTSFLERETQATAGIGLEHDWTLLRLRGLARAGAVFVQQEGGAAGGVFGTQPHANLQAICQVPFADSFAVDLAAGPGITLARGVKGNDLRGGLEASAGISFSFF